MPVILVVHPNGVNVEDLPHRPGEEAVHPPGGGQDEALGHRGHEGLLPAELNFGNSILCWGNGCHSLE